MPCRFIVISPGFPFPDKLQFALQVGQCDRLLAPLAYFPLYVVARLPVYLDGRQPERENPYVYQSDCDDAVRRIVARSIVELHPLGRIARCGIGCP